MRALLFGWGAGLLLVLSSLMTDHWAPLPTPTAADELLARGVASLRASLPGTSSTDPANWTLVHVLYADCGCSRRVVDHIAERPAAVDLHEVVLMVGEPDEDFREACRSRALPTVELTRAELAERFGIEAAPLFVVVDPTGRPVHVGGYTERKQGLAFRDLEVAAQLRAGAVVEAAPVYGCGVSDSLQQALDPLGIKY